MRHFRRRFQRTTAGPFLPWRTVAENVAFGLELRRMPKADIDRIVADKLAMVGLTQWAGKFGHELSGGMQQRVGLARAFATDADILLMDEPFSALDPLIRDKLQDELLALMDLALSTGAPERGSRKAMEFARGINTGSSIWSP